jgi:hypothetical protein
MFKNVHTDMQIMTLKVCLEKRGVRAEIFHFFLTK